MENLKITLAAARVNAGLTQNEVARKMKVSRQTIMKWEHNKLIPKPAEILMLSQIYNIPIDNIFLRN